MSAQVSAGLVLIVALSFTFSGVAADDFNPPPWRTTPPGLNGTTHQVWDFSTNASPVVANINNNPFGAPMAAAVGSFPKTRWINVDHGHQGVWKIEPDVNQPAYLELTIPNTPAPFPYKEVRVQMTFSAANGLLPLTTLIPAPVAAPTSVAFQQLDQYYYYASFEYTLAPSVNAEELRFSPADCTVYIDSVIVDTRVVPEPASCLVLLVPVAMFGMSRRY
jgi:hypothetical protein